LAGGCVAFILGGFIIAVIAVIAGNYEQGKLPEFQFRTFLFTTICNAQYAMHNSTTPNYAEKVAGA
jgi:hypothetical protein